MGPGVREFGGELLWDAPAGGADSDGGFASVQIRYRLVEFKLAGYQRMVER
jgi:hypothetical protein